MTINNKIDEDLKTNLLKLKEALEYYANSTIGKEIEPGKFQFPIVEETINLNNCSYIIYDSTVAKEALKLINTLIKRYIVDKPKNI